jgi:hypothetical protein
LASTTLHDAQMSQIGIFCLSSIFLGFSHSIHPQMKNLILFRRHKTFNKLKK